MKFNKLRLILVVDKFYRVLSDFIRVNYNINLCMRKPVIKEGYKNLDYVIYTEDGSVFFTVVVQFFNEDSSYITVKCNKSFFGIINKIDDRGGFVIGVEFPHKSYVSDEWALKRVLLTVMDKYDLKDRLDHFLNINEGEIVF